MWRKSLHATPLTNLGSDRICAIRLSLTGSPQRTSMHIIYAYLPSSDHTIEEDRKYVGDLVSIISTLEPYGPLILVGDLNSLDPEHICFGGETLRLWLKKIFNRIIALEQIPSTLNEGLIIPVHKGKGKDPFKPESYRGITLSSVISKLFEIILLRRLSPILEEVGVPDFAQTAYQKGISCADAIFATQEALLTHVRDGGKPFLCLYDIEKAFDSVELPILLKQLFSIGINGKLWRLLKHWYSTSSAKVKVNGHISSSFDICRGVRQGSVLSPTLFLAVMDILLKWLRESGHGLHVRGTYMGGAIHADDLRTTAASSDSVTSQDKVIKSFTTESCLRLNTSKFEAVKISPHHHETAVSKSGTPVSPPLTPPSVLGYGGTPAFLPSTLCWTMLTRLDEPILLLEGSGPFRVT